MIKTSSDNQKESLSGSEVLPGLPDKRYFKIGEVCEITGVKKHVLRYWESEFPFLSPPRARSKQRLYRKVDVENVLKIKRLLRDEGFTIQGAKKVLSKAREQNEEPVQLELVPEPVAPAQAGGEMVSQLKDELIALKKMLEE